MAVALNKEDRERAGDFVAAQLQFGIAFRCGDDCGFRDVDDGDPRCGLFGRWLLDDPKLAGVLMRCEKCLEMFPRGDFGADASGAWPNGMETWMSQ